MWLGLALREVRDRQEDLTAVEEDLPTATEADELCTTAELEADELSTAAELEADDIADELRTAAELEAAETAA